MAIYLVLYTAAEFMCLLMSSSSFTLAHRLLHPADLLWCAAQFLDFFLKGNLSLERHPRRKPHDWLPEQGWQDLMRLMELAAGKQAQGGEHRQFAASTLPAC